MDSPSHAARIDRPVASSSAPVGLFRYLYNTNPFYLISAALVMGGLHVLFYDRAAAAHLQALTLNSWLLLGVLSGYALLLAVTGCVIVRFGRVWDDARTILLTIVILFVAMSVSFDKLVLTDSATLPQVMLAGLVFAVVVTEMLLGILKIRLPVLFRAPFHLTLCLFFLYPVFLTHLLDRVGDTAAQRGFEWTLWGILLFPTAAAGITLMLLPAVWCGPRYVAHNGTPWRWPMFPWSLFAVLGVAVVLRSYWLSISFHPYPGTKSAFGVHFLVPFLLAVSVVVFELGRSAGRKWVQTISLAAPHLLLVLAFPGEGYSKVYGQFLDLFMDRFGSPVVMTWWGLLGLHAYAWLRGSRHGESGLVAMLVVGSVLGSDTIDLRSLRFPAIEPLLAATMLLVVKAIWQPAQSVRWFLAWTAAIGTLSVVLWDTPFVAFGGAAPLHLEMVAVLMLGLVFRDDFAQVLQSLGAAGLVLASAFGLIASEKVQVLPADFFHGYLAVLSLMAWGNWFALRGRIQFVAAGIVTGCWLGYAGLLVAAAARRIKNPTGVWLMLAGMLSFLMAVVISGAKGGIWSRLRKLSGAAPDASGNGTVRGIASRGPWLTD